MAKARRASEWNPHATQVRTRILVLVDSRLRALLTAPFSRLERSHPDDPVHPSRSQLPRRRDAVGIGVRAVGDLDPRRDGRAMLGPGPARRQDAPAGITQRTPWGAAACCAPQTHQHATDPIRRGSAALTQRPAANSLTG